MRKKNWNRPNGNEYTCDWIMIPSMDQSVDLEWPCVCGLYWHANKVNRWRTIRNDSANEWKCVGVRFDERQRGPQCVTLAHWGPNKNRRWINDCLTGVRSMVMRSSSDQSDGKWNAWNKMIMRQTEKRRAVVINGNRKRRIRPLERGITSLS